MQFLEWSRGPLGNLCAVDTKEGGGSCLITAGRSDAPTVKERKCRKLHLGEGKAYRKLVG